MEKLLIVPKTEQGMEELYYGILKDESCETHVIPEREFYDNFMAFMDINEVCDLHIDDFESETIPAGDCELSLQVIKEYEMPTLKKALSAASAYGTCVKTVF